MLIYLSVYLSIYICIYIYVYFYIYLSPSLPLSTSFSVSACISRSLTLLICVFSYIWLSRCSSSCLSRRRGIWNVPYLTGVYVIQRSVLVSPETRPNYIYKLLDADMAMAANMREKVCCLWCFAVLRVPFFSCSFYIVILFFSFTVLLSCYCCHAGIN